MNYVHGMKNFIKGTGYGIKMTYIQKMKLNIGVKHMRYVITLFWGVLLVFMINYILGSMTNVTNLTFDKALIVGVIFSVIIMVLGSLFNETPSSKEHHS